MTPADIFSSTPAPGPAPSIGPTLAVICGLALVGIGAIGYGLIRAALWALHHVQVV